MVDGNLVTGQNPASSIPMVKAIPLIYSRHSILSRINIYLPLTEL